ncbi:hypothetical protein [Paracoccus lutimaris]|uniref:Uncharacterized protein n=1 Tax=Paracoccus lutimaris TaxID=1490030 RepID=A0A368YCG5_9RHOB|nr:hypothetical protein [Paracoccus lutimaris]RCW77815.1 hypothetical protein DFP89_1569 [Paracoccus lutimaris]
MTDHPKSGGRYDRDPETGQLSRRTAQGSAEIPTPLKAAAPAEDTAPPAPTTKPKKGGR